MKVAFISDIHCGELIEHRPGNEAPELLNRFLCICRTLSVDVIFELGDRVNNKDHDSDISNLQIVNTILKNQEIPVFHAIGNHDCHYISCEENIDILGLPTDYYSITINGIKFIVLNTSEEVFGECEGFVSKRQLEWLKNELSDDMYKVICSHHPVYTQDQSGNPFFKEIPDQYKIRNDKDVMDVIKTGRNVIAVFNGHVHWDYHTLIGPIPAFSIASLTEAYPVTACAPGRFCIVDFDEDKINCASISMNPMRYLGRSVFYFN